MERVLVRSLIWVRKLTHFFTEDYRNIFYFLHSFGIYSFCSTWYFATTLSKYKLYICGVDREVKKFNFLICSWGWFLWMKGEIMYGWLIFSCMYELSFIIPLAKVCFSSQWKLDLSLSFWCASKVGRK